MPSNRGTLEESWRRTRGHLDAAARLLPAAPKRGSEGGSFAAYLDWLEHNELELALDELLLLGEANSVVTEFWQALLDTANEMKLDARAAHISGLLTDR
jgi:hypothetical protein